MRAARTLATLVAGLRGEPVDDADWPALIELANHTLLTPALHASLDRSGQLGGLPVEVSDYLRFIHDCNRERNERLSDQLKEAVSALNRRRVVPLLLKGAVPLFLASDDRFPSRMTSDLDLAVEAKEVSLAEACLAELGYVQIEGDRGMARPQDAGPVEIRPIRRLDGAKSPVLVNHAGLHVRIDPPHARALHWILHDLVKEGDYWRGRIDLRHLHDLAQLDDRDGVDWCALRQLAPDCVSRRAVDVQLLTLREFFGTEIPAECARGQLVRFHSWRRVFTATHPLAGSPLRLTGSLFWLARRLSQSNDLVQRGPFDLARRVVRTIRDRRSKI